MKIVAPISLPVSLLLASALAFSACAPKNSVNETQKKLEEIRTNLPDPNKIVADSLASTVKGGQPGTVKVTGVVVGEDSQLDSRVSLVVEGGNGKDGKKAKVNATNQPTLSLENADADLTHEMGLKTLISVGCPDDVTAEAATARSLEVRQVPEPLTKQLMIVRAKTILLCGNLSNIDIDLISFYADEVVLNEVKIAKTGPVRWIKVVTNKLVLIGNSSLTTKGEDSSQPLLPAPSLELHVGKELEAIEGGKLNLVAIGSNYIAKKETVPTEPKTEPVP